MVDGEFKIEQDEGYTGLKRVTRLGVTLFAIECVDVSTLLLAANNEDYPFFMFFHVLSKNINILFARMLRLQ